MDLGTVLIALAGLVGATVVGPIAIATLVQRQGPAAAWLRRHGRWIFGIAALLSLSSIVLDLRHGQASLGLEFAISALYFACLVGAALLWRPSEAPDAPGQGGAP